MYWPCFSVYLCMFSVFVEKWEFRRISHDNTENQIFLPLQGLVFLLFVAVAGLLTDIPEKVL